MSFFKNIIKRYKNATPKQLILAGVFMLAIAGAAGGGLLSRQSSSAAVYYGRDNGDSYAIANSIDNSNNGGGVGALSKTEFISDVNYNNPGDLQGIYDHFGLQRHEYQRFLDEAKEGIVYKNGEVIVDGQTVMTNTWSIGRKSKSYSWAYPINGVGTYHASMSNRVQGSDLPVYVMFDENGTVEFVVMKACGNTVGGDKVQSSARCDALNQKKVGENKYEFTTSAPVTGHSRITKLEYYSNGSKFATETDPNKAVSLTITKDTTVSVKVYVSQPGNSNRVIEATNCKKDLKFEEKVYYACKALIKTVIDEKSRKYRFTVKTEQTNNVKVKSADFKFGSKSVDGITTKNSDGNIYTDYTFGGAGSYKVSVIVNFEVNGKIVKSTQECHCEVEIPEVCKYNPALPPNHPDCKEPKCIYDPNLPVNDPKCKEPKCLYNPQLPVNDPNCKEPKCEYNPQLPVNDPNCKPPKPPVCPGKQDLAADDPKCKEELPHTGPAGIASLFAGISAFGAIGHRLYMNRRNRG